MTKLIWILSLISFFKTDNLLDDYYSGDIYKDLLEKWVSDNVDLIKTAQSNSLDKMKEIV